MKRETHRIYIAAFAFSALCWFVLQYSTFAQQDSASRINEIMTRYHDEGHFNGAVLVAKDFEVIYKKGFGFANMEWKIPNTPDTKFRICSITKSFTAMLIMQLVEQGNLKLDGTISDYLPDYRKDTGKKVTVHHLLTHVSGIPNYTMMPGFMEDKTRDPYTVAEFLKLYCSGDLIYEPGSEYKYNNSGYFILGAIIERITGKSYEEVLKEKILEPLGMKGTGYDYHQLILEKRAAGYVRTEKGLVNAPYLDMSWAWSAGAIYSTVEDLYVWDQALYTEKLLSKKYKDIMFTPYLKENACGWFVKDMPLDNSGKKLRVLSHPGEVPGFRTLISRLVEDRQLIVLLCNVSGGEQARKNDEITSGIIKILYQ